MIAAGIWLPRSHRAKRSYPPRERRDCVGQLVQIDGSEHAWFEARGPVCTLLVYVDDATSRLMGKRPVKDVLDGGWVACGLPADVERDGVDGLGQRNFDERSSERRRPSGLGARGRGPGPRADQQGTARAAVLEPGSSFRRLSDAVRDRARRRVAPES